MSDNATPVDDYVAAAVVPGQVDYYALLFAAGDQRERLSQGIALGKVILNIPRQQTESQIRQLKLHWWLEEIQRCEKGEPRHPLTRELSPATATTEWLRPLQRLVRGALDDVEQQPLTSLQLLLPYAHHVGERQALLATLHPSHNDDDLASARAAGVGIALTDLLAGDDPRLDPTIFDVTGAELTRAQVAEVAMTHFDAMAGEPAQPIIAMQASLHQQKLQRLAANHFADDGSVHPLRLLWQAWRQGRKLRA